MSERIQMPANDNASLTRSCAICGKPQLARFKPFCSKRCADIDLGRWMKGTYAVPVAEVDENTEEDR